ncbi:DUF488 family protein [Roseomonas sp. BN140053]|uniref:DUF488 domain-containing protein n=1 Tax=Roseomonas sp. BN140053 TaxID=3391898 RepID=UPI0039EAB0C4
MHTIGYEGAAIAGFLTALEAAGVSLVVDVRAVAVSRRKGFSKTALGLALADAGIRYMHLRDLGDPKPGREAARAGKMAAFRRIYRAHLATDAAQQALSQATGLAQAEAACLLCYEAEPTGCHRSIVAAAIAETTGLGVHHIYVDGLAGRTTGFGEGRPTAE